MLDSDWEAEFCRVAESHPQVIAYIRTIISDWKSLTVMAQKHGNIGPTSLSLWMMAMALTICCISLSRSRATDARTQKRRKSTMETYWVPGVNHIGTYGRWSFSEFTEVYQIESDFKDKIQSELEKMIELATAQPTTGGQ